MGSFKLLQSKRSLLSTPVAPTSSLLRPSRPLVPTSPPVAEPVAPTTQEQLERAARLGHSFARIPLFPPEKKNNAGLPEPLKAGIESLSGLPLDDVQVHYNSTKPAEVQSLAYTQGTDIHVGPGQEKYLAHEAWHVVQQKQGHVEPTVQVKGRKINDEEKLEREASVMATKASQMNQVQQDAIHALQDATSFAVADRVTTGQLAADLSDPFTEKRQDIRTVTDHSLPSRVVQRMRRFGFAPQHMTAEHYTESGMSTFLSMIYDPGNGQSVVPLGETKSTKSVTHGSEHAEDVALRIINTNITLFSPPPPAISLY